MKKHAPYLIYHTYMRLKALKGTADDRNLMEKYEKVQSEANRNIGDAVLSSLYDSHVIFIIRNLDELYQLFAKEHSKVAEPEKEEDLEVAGTVAKFIKPDKALLEFRHRFLAHHKRMLWEDATSRYYTQHFGILIRHAVRPNPNHQEADPSFMEAVCKSFNYMTLVCCCLLLLVPLDYLNSSSNASLKLDLVKISAVKEPKAGTILFNPGGPGGSGRESFIGLSAAALSVVTGGIYDLISFDPRGVGNTIPFSCYPNDTLRTTYNLKAPVFLNSSDNAIGAIWAARQTLVRSCLDNAKDRGDLIGTGYVARDLMQIVDALDEGGLLNYLGISYGTLLGSTVAAMFPDRMGKLVLDSVINPHDYYAGRDVSGAIASDRCFDGFIAGCLANPQACALAQEAKDARQLESQIYGLLDSIKYNPFVIGSDLVSGIIDYSVLKMAIFNALYSPVTWPLLAAGIQGTITKNATQAAKLVAFNTPEPTVFPSLGYEASQGIRSGDVSLRTDNLTSLLPLIDEFCATSRILWDGLSSPTLTYAQWPFKAKGGYTGNFQVKTKNPILFIGSDMDPITPLASARNASAGFEGSVVLQHEGYGHPSVAQPSVCTLRAIRDYFVNGSLPAAGTKCSPDFGLFSNTTLANSLVLVSKRALQEEDNDGARLLAAAMQLNAIVPRAPVV
ncbi:MAG: hypothetical protein Q9182_001065 [Xanthomendoza sp. 2 TL-2023]